MIAECKQYLIRKIRAVMGEETRVFTTMKELQECEENHMAGVLIASDSNVRNGSRVRIATLDGLGKAEKLFDRTVGFTVMMSEYGLEALEPSFESFLLSLDKGFALSNSYYVDIELGKADWMFREDSKLKAAVTVELLVTFQGGLYRPLELRRIADTTTTIEEVPQHG